MTAFPSTGSKNGNLPVEMVVVAERPEHADIIETLNDLAFGADRFTKTTYRLREGVAPVAELGLVAQKTDAPDAMIMGTIRYWPVQVPGGAKTLLLGPLAIHPDHQGQGVGRALMRASLEKARALGWQAVLLVGDAPYYGRFGFKRELAQGLSLPGPVDEDRFLGLELTPGALKDARGEVTHAL